MHESVAPVTLAFVADELEAEMLCGLLREHGIDCAHRRNDIRVTSVYAYGSGGRTEILVRPVDLDAAWLLLASNEPSGQP